MAASGAAAPPPLESVSSPLGAGGPDLVVALSASAAARPGAVALTCTSLGGTAVAVLEVDETQGVQGLVEVLSERLEVLLARSSGWRQRLRLAYPDGSLLPEPLDTSLTVRDLMASDAWRKAEARGLRETDQTSPAATPTRGGRLHKDSSKAKLEGSLKRLQEAKNLPLTAKVEPKQEPPKNEASTQGRGGSGGAPNVATAAAARQGAHRGHGSDPASREAGGRVLLVSSLDWAHPGDSVIDGSEKTYWLSTGLYPQEILVELGRPSRVAGVRLSTTNVRGVRIEGCSEHAAVQFETLAAGELEAAAGCLQRKELRCSEQAAPTRFVKTMILSGWHDFCSVHRITVME